MKSILGKKGLELLKKIAQENTALVFDYDGTLAPYVFKGFRAKMRPRTRKALAQVAKLNPTAVLSGRSVADLRSLMDGRSLIELIGNHGLEWSQLKTSKRILIPVAQWKAEISRALKSGEIHPQGVEIEDKKASLSIHYRHAKNPTRVKREIHSVMKQFRGVKFIEGSALLNLLPDVGVNKGTAVTALKKKLRCDYVVFLGDDRTDEYAFALRPKSFLVDIRVRRSSSSKARYFLANQEEIDVFLEKWIEFRK